MFHKNNRKKYLCHFDDDDIIIDDFRLNPVHILPQGQWNKEQEIDFYMDDGANIYLLRIINRNENIIKLIDDKHNSIRYIIIHINVENTFDMLRKIIKRMKEIPYSSKINGEGQTYNLFNKF